MDDRLLTSREFAQRCGVVPETVRRWVRAGRVSPAGATPGGQLRFAEAQVDEALGRGPSERALDIEAHVRSSLARLRARRRGVG